ncbi:proline--tRNA ligase [Candidatus Micrarchaeota archaeon]|nr:proline--tRNA ligase [Candidatus Micrarchaeota archaeon]
MALENKKNENFGEWYLELVQKAQLMEYSPIQGCMIIRPRAYFVWQQIQDFLNNKFAEEGVQNAYFPMFIPESMLKKEASHFAGFTPEVAWVTKGGNEDLSEPLALRPTSETIIYSTYAKWVSSHRDLPLLLNQWANIIRWDTKTLKPFLRTREFLWQEGHTAHASREDAEAMVAKALNWYREVCQDLLAMPVMAGVKSRSETFPGAEYTTTVEALMPDGKALQCGTSHNLGQSFSKMFDVKYKTNDEKQEYCWMTSWGVSTRLIGAAIMLHSDDKGLVLPPKIAQVQVVIVPIFKDLEEKKMALLSANKIVLQLREKGVRVHVDDREDKSPGFKFNEWELYGVPVRIEIGLRDLAKQGVTIARRDGIDKDFVSEEKVIDFVLNAMQDIQTNLFSRAKLFLDSSIIFADQYKDLKIGLEHKKLVQAYCCDEAAEEIIKQDTQATSRLIELTKEEGKCVITGKPTKSMHYFAKSY